jgi:hypothetical protein
MYATSMTVNPAEASVADRAMLGGKAATLAELSAAAGFAVPPGIVVTVGALDEPDLDGQLQAAVARLGGDRFAVRSSGAAEDLRMPHTPACTRATSMCQPNSSMRRCGDALPLRHLSMWPPIRSGTAACRPRWRCWCRRWSIR